MTKTFPHFVSRFLAGSALAFGASLFMIAPAVGQQTPAPPEPQAEDEASEEGSKEASDESKADEESEATQDRSSERERDTGRSEARDRASGRARDTARDASGSSRSDADDADDDEDEDSYSGRITTGRDARSRSSRDASRRSTREDDDDSFENRRSTSRDDFSRDDDSERRDTRSFSRETDDFRSTRRDDRDDDFRSSSRDRVSSRDREDRSFREDERSFREDDRSFRDDDRSFREDVRDTARDVRDTARDVRDTARDTVRDVRDTARSTRESVSRRSSRQEFDVSTVRSADVGLWFDRSTRDGLVIRDVATSGPITRFGFREGDRIVSIDGYRVSSERQFVQDLFHDDIRYERVPVVVYRNGAERTIYVQPDLLVEHYTSVQSDPLEEFGLVLDDRYTNQLVVWKVIPRTPAYYSGIRAGDVITAWDNRRVTRQDQLVQLVQQAEESGDSEVRLTVYRSQQPRQLEIEFPEVATRIERRTSYRPAVEVQEGTRVYESYPAVEGTVRPGVITRPGILPRRGILPRNR